MLGEGHKREIDQLLVTQFILKPVKKSSERKSWQIDQGDTVSCYVDGLNHGSDRSLALTRTQNI